MIVHNDELGIYGVGNTKEEAEKDLKVHFDYYYNYYKKHKDEDLTTLGLRPKKKFMKTKGIL